jgi:hypothetical protein
VIRQRIALRTPMLAYVVRALTFLLALALIWYGLMVVLLAVKVSAHTVNAISAYRTLFHDVAGIDHGDFTTTRRLILGFGGLIAFLLFGYLAWQELPRPYLARGEVQLEDSDRGATVIEPRAVERVAELAAVDSPDVIQAAGRLGDEELNVNIGVNRATSAARSVEDVHRRVRAELNRHQLPSLPVNVTLTSYDRKTRRELS